jgi:hypothetical protein
MARSPRSASLEGREEDFTSIARFWYSSSSRRSKRYALGKARFAHVLFPEPRGPKRKNSAREDSEGEGRS